MAVTDTRYYRQDFIDPERNLKKTLEVTFSEPLGILLRPVSLQFVRNFCQNGWHLKYQLQVKDHFDCRFFQSVVTHTKTYRMMSGIPKYVRLQTYLISTYAFRTLKHACTICLWVHHLKYSQIPDGKSAILQKIDKFALLRMSVFGEKKFPSGKLLGYFVAYFCR